MSNPKKVYISPEVTPGFQYDREFSFNRTEPDWVEYVRADEIKSIIEKIDYEVENEIESDTYILSFLEKVSNDLKKLIEK